MCVKKFGVPAPGFFIFCKNSKFVLDNHSDMVYHATSTVGRRRNEVDYKANSPIYLQVIQDIKRKIISGELKYGEKLPSSRELALQYQINPNTAARVYNEMELEGLTFTRRGIGTFVTEEPIGERLRKEIRDELLEEFDRTISGLGYTPEEIVEMVGEYYQKERRR